MTNLLVSMLDKAGVTVEKLGDSTGTNRSRCAGGDLMTRRRVGESQIEPCERCVASRCLIAAVASSAWAPRLAPPVVEAVKDGNIEAVRTLLAKRADPNAAEADGTTALHWAAHFDNLAAADLLIRAGANAQAANRYGATPLWLACVNGSAAMIERLLSAGADPNTTMPEGDTALMTAARTGNVAAVRALLTRGARRRRDAKSGRDRRRSCGRRPGTTPPRSRRSSRPAPMCSARTKYQTVPLFQTGGFGRRAERNSDVTKQSGFTALHFAVRAGALDAIKVLLKSGATVNDTTADGTGVLVMAIASTHFELADWLLEQGADPNAAEQGWTPLHQIAYTRRPNTGVNNPGLVPRDKLDSLTLARKLMARGADPNKAATKNPDVTSVGRKRLTEEGATPFWVAAQTLDLPYMRLLVEHGADALRAERHGRYAAAGGVGPRHREAGRESGHARRGGRGGEVLPGSRRRRDDGRRGRQHGAARRGGMGIERRGRDAGRRRRAARREEQERPNALAHRRGRRLRRRRPCSAANRRAAAKTDGSARA